MLRRVERGVGPVERHVVRERHISGAHVVVLPEQRERVFDRVPTLETEQRSDVAARVARADRVRRERPLELRVLLDYAPRDVDLLELHARVAGRAGHYAIRGVRTVGALAGNVDGPELSADVSLLETR